MTLEEQFNFLNFWINKTLGSWYAISDLELLLDRGQMAVYNDYQPKASTSQRIKDALSPFRATYDFTPSDTLNGVITMPGNSDYLNLLDIQIRYAISGRSMTKYVGLALYNEDERADRLNSQIDPVAATSPIAEQIGDGQWQLYPKVQYFGSVSYYRRPAKPVFGYSLISGRVIVYDPSTSTELEWKETQQNEILLKALASVGINLGEGDIMQWANANNQNNYLNVNNL